MRISLAGLRFDGVRIESWSDALLRVVAEIDVRVADLIIYREVEFRVVEFAYQLHRWLICELDGGADFEYRSMESDDNPLIWIRQIDSVWRWGSRFGQGDVSVSIEDVRVAAGRFITDLDDRARRQFDLKLLAVLLDATGASGNSPSGELP